MQYDELEYVGFWPRVGASILDAALLMLVTSPPLIAIYGLSYFTDDEQFFIAGPADFLISWVFPAVGTACFWIFRQATPGKMAVSARVVDAETGGTISVAQSIVRYFGYFISMLPLFLGIIWIAFDPKKQAWHDKLARTVVVRSRNREYIPVTFGGP